MYCGMYLLCSCTLFPGHCHLQRAIRVSAMAGRRGRPHHGCAYAACHHSLARTSISTVQDRARNATTVYIFFVKNNISWWRRSTSQTLWPPSPWSPSTRRPRCTAHRNRHRYDISNRYSVNFMLGTYYTNGSECTLHSLFKYFGYVKYTKIS